MPKTPRHKLLKRAERYWSNPDVRLARTNYKRRLRGLPEYTCVEQIPTQSEIAARIPRGRYERFARTGRDA
jgi:hypothetical protein